MTTDLNLAIQRWMRQEMGYLDCIVAGRAATLIFLSLQAHSKPGYVIVPSHFCISPLIAITLASYEPLPVHVDPHTLDYCRACLSKAILRRDAARPVTAVVLPHMYGYEFDWSDVLDRIPAGTLLIEDRAQSLGHHNPSLTGSNFQVVTLYSFSRTKHVQSVRAGILASNSAPLLASIRSLLSSIQVDPSVDVKTLEAEYSRQFRASQGPDSVGNEYPPWFLHFCRSMPSSMWVRPVAEGGVSQLKHELSELPSLLERRLLRHQTILASLGRETAVHVPRAAWTAVVPWRTTVLIEHAKAVRVVRHLRANGLPVSSWYSDVSGLTSDQTFSKASVEDESGCNPSLGSLSLVNFFLDDPVDSQEKSDVLALALEVLGE